MIIVPQQTCRICCYESRSPCQRHKLSISRQLQSLQRFVLDACLTRNHVFQRPFSCPGNTYQLTYKNLRRLTTVDSIHLQIYLSKIDGGNDGREWENEIFGVGSVGTIVSNSPQNCHGNFFLPDWTKSRKFCPVKCFTRKKSYWYLDFNECLVRIISLSTPAIPLESPQVKKLTKIQAAHIRTFNWVCHRANSCRSLVTKRTFKLTQVFQGFTFELHACSNISRFMVICSTGKQLHVSTNLCLYVHFITSIIYKNVQLTIQNIVSIKLLHRIFSIIFHCCFKYIFLNG